MPDFCFKILLVGFAFCGGCSNPQRGAEHARVTFAAMDVGQGLSQILIADTSCVVFDMGDSSVADQWLQSYRFFGSPHIAAIVISHPHMDHYGGLLALKHIQSFSGTIVIGMADDTACYCDFIGSNAKNIHFRKIAQGDTIAALKGVGVGCLWPPFEQVFSDAREGWVNRNSLVFKVTHGYASAFLSADVDTTALASLCTTWGEALAADILVLAHHGAKNGFSPPFYGYVNPEVAIVSCGANNGYGHPSQDVVTYLIQEMGATVRETRFEGDIIAVSNGFYWDWK